MVMKLSVGGNVEADLTIDSTNISSYPDVASVRDEISELNGNLTGITASADSMLLFPNGYYIQRLLVLQ